MSSFELILFYLFSSVALISAMAVVTVKNPVHAALSLVLTFFNIACIWILMHAEFLGVALILVYVGAVMVLFLFVVMMLDIDVVPLREGFARFLPVAAGVAAVMLLEMLLLLGKSAKVASAYALEDHGANSNIVLLGQLLFDRYMLPFEVAALILTVAIIAAVALTLRHRVGVRTQDPGKQVLVRKQDRIRLIKMAAVKPETEQ